MLTLYHNSQEIVLDTTEYYVRELASGLDEIIFNISIWDPNYALIAEEASIVDRGGQRYLVKQIDAGAVTAKVVCQLDLDDWKASLAVGYDSGSKTVAQQISAVLPAGWTMLDKSGSSISRTLHGDYTPLQVCEACRDVYSVYMRWDNKIKRVTIYTQAMGTPAGSFATRELNLKEINYKGKSNNFVTRLYAYGKEGLSFADINGGKPYVDDNTYSSRIICGYWQDDRYTVEQNLLDDAREKLAKLAVPERSYDCAIVDLQATNPALYNNLSFELFTAATLIDDSRDTAINYQVVERHVWPYHPDRNDVIFNSSPVKIQNTVVQIEDDIINPNSTFSQIWANRVQEATEWMTQGGGYLIALQDPTGTHWTDLLAMDTDDLTTAQDVLRINMNGIGFSHTGVNGPYTSAWTIDGKFNADFILAGHMSANYIQAGVLESTATTTVGGVQVPVTSINMDTGDLTTYSGTFKGSITAASISGGSISGASISGGSITSTSNDNTKTTTISGGSITTNSITATGGTFSNVTITGYATTSDLNNYATTAGLAAGTTIINGGCIQTNTLSCDTLNGGTINGQSISGGTISGTSITGGTVSGAQITTGTNSGSKLVLESGEITGYYNNAVHGKINMVSGGIRMGESGSVFDAYIDVLDNNIINLGAGTLKINGTACVSGSFIDKNGHTVTVTQGLITDIF